MPVSVSTGRALRIVAALAIALGTAHCTSLLGDFDSGGTGGPDASMGEGGGEGGNDANVTADGQATNEAGIVLGTPCTTAAQCGGGACSDGVCCDVPCDGVCMRCDVTPNVGKCSPVPAKTDPDKECVALPVPEAGMPVVDAAPMDAAPTDASGDGAPTDAGTSTDANPGASDAAPIEAGPMINYPDGGLDPDAGPCAGSCNGAGACAYPATEKGCGAQFCNTTTQLARTTCDGTGRCSNIALSDCTDYSCEKTACKTTCSSQSDCQATDRCNGTNCAPKLGDGVACALPTDCQSGNCVQVSGGAASVCCNSPCNFAGGNCAASGSTTGQCTCPACATGGACAVFYPDNDNDGHGDRNATVATANPSATNAVVACAGTPPVHGAGYPAAYYVTNNDDCADQDSTAYPGAWFSTSAVVGVGGYDHDCDGKTTYEYPQFYGASCHVCTAAAPSCGTSSCGATGAEGFSTLSCEAQYGNCCSCYILLNPVTTQSLVKQNFSENPDLIIRPLCCACTTETCGPNDTAGFTDTSLVNCGAYGTYTSCGSCSGTTLGSASYSSLQQACR